MDASSTYFNAIAAGSLAGTFEAAADAEKLTWLNKGSEATTDVSLTNFLRDTMTIPKSID